MDALGNGAQLEDSQEANLGDFNLLQLFTLEV
jgi:hypothetical protein